VPELPEVEVVRQGLERHVTGRTIGSVQVLHPRAVRRHAAGAGDFSAALSGLTVTGARRRGKYLWLPVVEAALSAPSPAEDALLAHLGMSGQLLLGDPGRPLSPHVRVHPPMIAHIAPDPLEPDFDEAAVISRLRSRRTGVKSALLDQSLISGVGNIYADEALWRARLHWATPAASLSRAAAGRLLAAVREVLAEALAAGGTSFDRLYVNVNGESGYFGRSLAVYGREGEPCPRCAAPIRRDPFMNRSAYSCPVCQPRPRRRARRAGRP
jgi:formamidopyrimidine-DNA glycosylase